MEKTSTSSAAQDRLRLGEALPFAGVAWLGAWLAQSAAGEISWPALLIAPPAVFLLASFAFLFNDWQDGPEDRLVPGKPARWCAPGGRFRLSAVTLGTAGAALALLACLGENLSLWAGLASLGLGICYSMRWLPFKQVPVLASLVHVLEGDLAFAIGWWSSGNCSWEALLPGLTFGLVFAAGHLHHEVRDLEADRRAGVRTCAVRFGPRRTMWAGFALWLGSAVPLSLFAWQRPAIPDLPAWINLLLVIGYLVLFLATGRGGDRASAKRLFRLRRLYRLLYLFGGLLMVAGLLAGRYWR